MTMVTIILPADCAMGTIKHRKLWDKNRKVDVTVPANVQIDWVEPSENGAEGQAIVEKDGTRWRFE